MPWGSPGPCPNSTATRRSSPSQEVQLLASDPFSGVSTSPDPCLVGVPVQGPLPCSWSYLGTQGTGGSSAGKLPSPSREQLTQTL